MSWPLLLATSGSHHSPEVRGAAWTEAQSAINATNVIAPRNPNFCENRLLITRYPGSCFVCKANVPPGRTKQRAIRNRAMVVENCSQQPQSCGSVFLQIYQRYWGEVLLSWWFTSGLGSEQEVARLEQAKPECQMLERLVASRVRVQFFGPPVGCRLSGFLQVVFGSQPNSIDLSDLLPHREPASPCLL